MKLCLQQKMNCRLFSDRTALAVEKPPQRAEILRSGFFELLFFRVRYSIS